MSATTFAVWLTGQAMLDRWWFTALCFYIPSPLAACMLIWGALLAWRWSGRRTAVVSGLLALAPMCFTLLVENHWSSAAPVPSAARSVRLLHWNVFGGAWGWPSIQQQITEANVDMCVLSEVPADASLELLCHDLGNFSCQRQGNLAVLARGSLQSEGRSLQRGTAVLVQWKVHETDLRVLVIDLPSSLAVKRDPLLTQVRDLIADDHPDLVVGDFNAPRRSLALRRLPEGYAHAYERVGAGWSYTWPVPLPLWAIDQCLVGPRIAPLSYDLQSTSASDHRFQLLEFALP